MYVSGLTVATFVNRNVLSWETQIDENLSTYIINIYAAKDEKKELFDIIAVSYDETITSYTDLIQYNPNITWTYKVDLTNFNTEEYSVTNTADSQPINISGLILDNAHFPIPIDILYKTPIQSGEESMISGLQQMYRNNTFEYIPASPIPEITSELGNELLPLLSINIDTLNYHKNIITWQFDLSNVPSLTDYEIHIYRSESPGLPNSLQDFNLVSDALSLSDTVFEDRFITGLHDQHRTWYYKLKIVEKATKKFASYPELAAFAFDSLADYAAREILRQKTLALERMSAAVFYLLKRRTWGIHCPICWDFVLARSNDMQCEECYGTGWVQGYFTPIPFIAALNTAPQYNQIQMFGEWKPSDVLLVALRYPPIVPRDVIVDDKGKRWLVLNIRYVEKMSRSIEQQIQASLLDVDDLIYNLPVPKPRSYASVSDTNNSRIELSSLEFNFTASCMGDIPEKQFLVLKNTNRNLSVLYNIKKHVKWLNISTIGSTIAPMSISDKIYISIETTNLFPRVYIERLKITGVAWDNSPQYITIKYTVT